MHMSKPIGTAGDGSSAFDDEVASAGTHPSPDHAAANETLMQKILDCERAESALRHSEGQLHALLAHQFSNREEERRRVALQIHDTLGQNLLALRLDVAALYQHTAARQTRLHHRAGAALANLDATISATRQLIADLRPFQLELGLHAALEWECSKFQRSSGIACTVTGIDALYDVVIDDAQLLTVYRVLQECLNNIVCHANASTVDIALGVSRKKLTMRVADNGAGIDPAHPPAPAFGLMSMRKRVGNAGGTFALTPVTPHGTAVTVTIPLAVRKQAPPKVTLG
jgi:signal transduction histidine kinase